MSDSSPIVFSMFTTTSHLNDTHALQWSVDDNICLLTDKGAIVFAPDFTFSDSSTSLYPHKHFIPNPSEPDPLAIQSTAKRFIDNQRPECDWFDHIHLTKGFASNYAKYQLSAWSPRVAQFGSLLALLTYDNRLSIYFSEANKWKLLADCTKILDAEIGSHYKGVPLVKAFEHLHKLSVNCMAWSPVFKEGEDEALMLVCCTSSGHCHFLKFSFTGRNASISLINSWRTGLDAIVFCEWFKEYLAICPLNGQLIVIKIPVQAITPEYDDWLMTPKVVPWREVDDMPVLNIIFLEIERGRYKIFFSKNCHVFIATMKEMVVARKTMLQLCGITVVETLVKTRITGLSLSPDNDLIFSSPDRLLTILRMKDDSTHLDQTTHPINSDEVVSNLTPLGLRTSRNRVLTCLAQTMTKLHDHLLLVEPTRIIIFPNLSFDAVTGRIEALVEDANLYSKYNSLREIMDLLNALRGYYSNNLNWIPKSLEKLLDGKWNWDASTLRSINFKILRFISLACVQRTPTNRTVAECENAVMRLEELILLEHVKFIHEKFWNQRHTLTRNQVLSLVTMASWASKHNLSKATWTNHDSSLETEKCPICGEDVSIQNFKEGLCPKNHRFGRCINSLLICDLISIKYELCKLCGRSLYSVPNIWQNYVECLFCH